MLQFCSCKLVLSESKCPFETPFAHCAFFRFAHILLKIGIWSVLKNRSAGKKTTAHDKNRTRSADLLINQMMPGFPIQESSGIPMYNSVITSQVLKILKRLKNSFYSPLCLAKHSLHRTGLSPFGSNGTLATPPHTAQVAS